jgi:hypothetical protein
MSRAERGVSGFVLTLALVSVVGSLAAALLFGSAQASASPSDAVELSAPARR